MYTVALRRGTSGMDARTLLLHFSSREAVQICSHPTVVHIYLAHEKREGGLAPTARAVVSPSQGQPPATPVGGSIAASPNTILTCRRISRGGCIAAARRGDCAGVPIPSVSEGGEVQ